MSDLGKFYKHSYSGVVVKICDYFDFVSKKPLEMVDNVCMYIPAQDRVVIDTRYNFEKWFVLV